VANWLSVPAIERCSAAMPDFSLAISCTVAAETGAELCCGGAVFSE
jgi:hypothetical protein